jgi:Family of unknown function (DUF5684)
MWFLAQTAEPTLYDAAETVDAVVVSNTTVDVNGGWIAFFTAMWIVWLVLAVLSIIAMWRIFTKAGEAGWKSLIPFYNTYLMFRIAGRNGWWFLGLFVPLLNIFVTIMLAIDLAKHFGKSTVFGIVGLWLFSIVGYFMLAFGSAAYVGPKHD